jgi:hypothetical protein
VHRFESVAKDSCLSGERKIANALTRVLWRSPIESDGFASFARRPGGCAVESSVPTNRDFASLKDRKLSPDESGFWRSRAGVLTASFSRIRSAGRGQQIRPPILTGNHYSIALPSPKPAMASRGMVIKKNITTFFS